MVAGSAQQTHLQEQRQALSQELQRGQEELEILRQQLSDKKEEERQASVAATTVLNEVMEALSLTPTTAANTSAATTAASDIGPCYHGSTSDHFSDGRAYRDLIHEYVSEEKVHGLEEGHLKYFQDLNFVQYTFALCTSWYLKTNQSTKEMNYILKLVMQIKYIHLNDGKFNSDQVRRYVRAIFKNDDRGVINCLYRETKPYCNCMKDKKTEADGMAKEAWCSGCERSVPRKGMLICSGCKVAMYCNEDCQTQHWPNHRETCKYLRKSRIFS